LRLFDLGFDAVEVRTLHDPLELGTRRRSNIRVGTAQTVGQVTHLQSSSRSEPATTSVTLGGAVFRIASVKV
jgi:hypothetical protein